MDREEREERKKGERRTVQIPTPEDRPRLFARDVDERVLTFGDLVVAVVSDAVLSEETRWDRREERVSDLIRRDDEVRGRERMTRA